MARTPILALSTLLALTDPGAAQPAFSLAPGVVLNFTARPAPGPDGHASIAGELSRGLGPLYGGMRARSVAVSDHAAEFDLYLGMRPSFGAIAMDLKLTQRATDVRVGAGAVAMSLSRPLGSIGAIIARLGYDAATDRARSETRASLRLGATTFDGGAAHSFQADGLNGTERLTFDLGAARSFVDFGDVDLRLRDPASSPLRAEFNWQVRF